MQQLDHLHRFKQCEIQSLSYCNECGIIQYKNLSTLKPKEFCCKREMDPTELFFQMKEKVEKNIIKEKETPAIINNAKVAQRKRSIAFMKFVIKKFDLDERIYHACIALMDYLLKVSPEEFLTNTDMYNLSSFIIIIKFGESGYDSVQIKNFILNTKEKQDMFNELESKILNWIDYNVGQFFIDYDLLNLVLHNGILLEEEKVENLPYVYLNCLLLLNSIKEKNFCVKYNSLQIVFSIIFVMRNAFGLDKNNNFFEEIYDYHMDEFRECFEIIKGQIKLKKAKVNRLI